MHFFPMSPMGQGPQGGGGGGGGDSVHVCVLPSHDLHDTVCVLTRGPNYRRLGGWGT